MFEDWVWMVVIIAIPFVIFGALELVGVIRRRRIEAIARRPKGPRRSSTGSRPRHTG